MGQAAIQQMVIGMISTNCYLCMNKETKDLFIVDPADQADLIVNMVDRVGGKPCAIFGRNIRYRSMPMRRRNRPWATLPETSPAAGRCP